MVNIEPPKITIPLRWAVMLVLVRTNLPASQIAKAICLGSSGVMRPSAATLYPYFTSLVKAGWIAEKWPSARPSEAGRPCFIYSLTDAGRCALQAHHQLHEDLANWEFKVEQGRVAS
jgi:DNA-binding PadR family transcriptional regulator